MAWHVREGPLGLERLRGVGWWRGPGGVSAAAIGMTRPRSMWSLRSPPPRSLRPSKWSRGEIDGSKAKRWRGALSTDALEPRPISRPEGPAPAHPLLPVQIHSDSHWNPQTSFPATDASDAPRGWNISAVLIPLRWSNHWSSPPSARSVFIEPEKDGVNPLKNLHLMGAKATALKESPR